MNKPSRMKVQKFSVEVHKRMCAMPEPADPLGALMKVANQVAREHPFWYERFRIASMIRRWFTWLRGWFR